MAARALASDVQTRNVKKAQISAKITSAICILEAISMMVLFIVRNIWQSYEVSMVLVIFFFYVAIPFTFLKNSSENKERLVDVGFLNIIQNTFGIPSRHTVNSDPTLPTISQTSDFGCSQRMGSKEEVRAWAHRLENPPKVTKWKNPNENDGTVLSDYHENDA